MIDLSGWKLTFDDEFDARSLSQDGAGTTWSDIRPQWRQDAESDTGFGHASFVDPGSGYDPFAVSGGALTITAVPDRTPYGVQGSWESGLISTQNSFSQTYGYFEMRAAVANAPGSWDAFWMLPEHPTADQELDVMEHLGDDDAGTYSTIHTTDPTPAQQLQVYSRDAAREGGYHTYGMDWEPDRISFYVDGQLMGSQATPSDMHSPMYLLADLATRDDASGPSMSMSIDYIRAFSDAADAAAVAQGAVSAPDGRDPGLYGASAAVPAAADAPAPTASAATAASTAVASTATAAAPVATPGAVPEATAAVPSPAAAVTSPAAAAADPLVAASVASIPDATVAVTLRADGRRTVDVQSSGGILHSDAQDTFVNHGQPSNRFVFDPGFGLDVVQQFRAGGADHDVLDLPAADFAGVADVLGHTRKAPGGIAITDPASGDTLRLTGVGKGQLSHNPDDMAFHG